MRESYIKHFLAQEISSALSVRTGLIGVALLLGSNSGFAASGDGLFFAGPEVCPLDVIDIPAMLQDARGTDPATQQIELESDQIESPDGSTLILTGNAQVIQGPQAIFAREIVYNKDSYTLNATDEVSLFTPEGDKLEMASLSLEMETFIGDAVQVDFQLADRDNKPKKRRLMDSSGVRLGSDFGILEDAVWGDKTEKPAKTGGKARANMRGEAEKVFFEGKDYQRLENARVTSCRVGQESVYLKASEVTLDHATGVGVGTNMSVRFFGVPIFYFPKASFPINSERKTGFLFPSIGVSESSGTIVEVPYYINIAPDKDATLNMRYLSDRGAQLIGEFRYLGENYDGLFRGAFLPGDDIYGDDRHAVSYKHNQRFGDNWRANVNVQDVSDTDYVDDFSRDIEISSSSFLDQRASVGYNGSIVTFDASVIDYQNIDTAISESSQPYEILPRLVLDAESPHGFAGPVRLGIHSEFVNYDHASDERITATRLDLSPYVSVPLKNVYGYVTPKVTWRNTTYSLDNVAPGEEDSPSLSVPIFSLDTGVAFERNTDWGGRPHYQTLEPRLFYVYAPEEDQDDIPIFDTGGGNLDNISNFYRDNRFFGPDRVGDSNRVTLGLKSRLIDSDDGQQRMQAEIAQIFYFDDRLVGVTPGDEPETEDKSDLLGDIRANVTEQWEVGASVRYSYEESATETVRIDAGYDRDSRRRVGMAYWYNRDSTQQVDLDLNWPLADKWQFGLREAYDIEEGENLATSMSISYDACCWAARVSGQRRVRRDEEDDETAIFFTLELKNLGKFSTAY